MRSRRFLLVPGNNSLSHVAKCLAVHDELARRGHEALVAVSRKHSEFVARLGIGHAVLPDIQENDDSGFPSVEWFREPSGITGCIDAEVKLMKEYRPDRVLGVFRFTLKASSALTGVPYDSLICGCMTPDSEEVLGFGEGEQGRDTQRIILDGFFRYAGSKIGHALAGYGLPGSNGDIRHHLKGERTFLWDFPEFAPLPRKQDLIHVGPLSWNGWPYDAPDASDIIGRDEPLAVVAFGTCTVCLEPARRIIAVLRRLGYRVLLAAGGQKEFLHFLPADPGIIVQSFARLHEILPHATLLVTHGGQLTVFEALQHAVPVVVMPFQPEQAHNGLCLERIGCGTRLVSSLPFQGNPQVYINSLAAMSDGDIENRINGLTRNTALRERLGDAQSVLKRYGGVHQLVSALEES